MQFIARKEDLLKELSLVQRVVDPRNTRPILANALLESAGDSVAVYATNLEVGLSGSFKAQIGRGGSITVPAKKFADIVRLLPDNADISIEVRDNNYIGINCGSIEYKLAGASKEDYPTVPQAAEDNLVEIPAGLLKTMIARTIYSITQEETRYALNGAQLAFDNESIRMVATDAHRLSLVEHPFSGYDGEAREILIPRKTVVEMSNLIDDRLDSIYVTKTESHLFFRVGSRVLDSRMLEGQFPNYQKVLPKDNDKTVLVNREEFAVAINRVALLSHETSRAIKLNFAPDRMVISSSNPEMGEAKEEIAIDFNGPEMSIGFNAKYLSDFIGTIHSERLAIDLRDESGAGLMRPEGDEHGSYRYVIMPMRV